LEREGHPIPYVEVLLENQGSSEILPSLWKDRFQKNRKKETCLLRGGEKVIVAGGRGRPKKAMRGLARGGLAVLPGGFKKAERLSSFTFSILEGGKKSAHEKGGKTISLMYWEAPGWAGEASLGADVHY